MDRKPRRRLDDTTATRITYGSPPPRSDADSTIYLLGVRHPGHLKPRHTHPDACAAQDRALDKEAVPTDSSKRAQVPRRDSGVTRVKLQDDDSSLTDFESSPEDAGGEVKPSITKLTIRSPVAKKLDKFEPSDGPNLLTPTSTHMPLSQLPANSRDEAIRRLPDTSESASTSRGRSPSKRSLDEFEASDDLAPPPPKANKSIPRTGSARRKSPLKATKRKPGPPVVTPAVPSREPASPPKQTRNNVKGIINKEDLTIAGTSKLDPTAPIEYVKEYKFKGKWYEVIGEEKPNWAEDERIVPRTAQVSTSRRSTGAWRRSIDR